MLDDDISQIRRQKWLQHCENLQGNELETPSSSSSSFSLPLLPDENISQSTSNQRLRNLTISDSDGNKNLGTGCNNEDIVGTAVASAPLRDSQSVAKIRSVGVGKEEVLKIDEKSKETKSCIDLTLSSDDESCCANDSKNGKYDDKKGKNMNGYDSRANKANRSDGSNGNTYKSECIKSNVIPEIPICTYNIWFKETHQSERMKQISSLVSDMKEQKPLFIGLQEVTTTLMQELFPLLESMGYNMICQPDAYDSYGVAIAILTQPQEEHCSVPSSLSYVSVVESGFHPFRDTIMGRGLLWVHADIIPKRRDRNFSSLSSRTSVLFTTTHLESFLPKHQYPLPNKENHDGAKARKNQILETINFCQKYKNSLSSSSPPIQATFITGDLNWDDERKKPADEPLLSIINDSASNAKNTKCWIDAWQKLYPSQRGYTYDSKLNPMLKGNLRRRFDRCLYYVENDTNNESINDRYNHLEVCSGKLIGVEAIEGIQWRKEVSEWKYGKPTGAVTHQFRPVCPSDHFGLYIKFGYPSKLASCEANKRGEKRKSNH